MSYYINQGYGPPRPRAQGSLNSPNRDSPGLFPRWTVAPHQEMSYYINQGYGPPRPRPRKAEFRHFKTFLGYSQGGHLNTIQLRLLIYSCSSVHLEAAPQGSLILA